MRKRKWEGFAHHFLFSQVGKGEKIEDFLGWDPQIDYFLFSLQIKRGGRLPFSFIWYGRKLGGRRIGWEELFFSRSQMFSPPIGRKTLKGGKMFRLPSLQIIYRLISFREMFLSHRVWNSNFHTTTKDKHLIPGLLFQFSLFL